MGKGKNSDDDAAAMILPLLFCVNFVTWGTGYGFLCMYNPINWILGPIWWVLAWVAGAIGAANQASNAADTWFTAIDTDFDGVINTDQVIQFMTRTNPGYKHKCPREPSGEAAVIVVKKMLEAKKAYCLEECHT